MNIKDPNLFTLSFSLCFFFFFCLLSSCSASSQWENTAFHRQGSWTAETSPSCYNLLFGYLYNYTITTTIMYSVCIHDRLHCVLFKAIELVEALHMPLSITELCLWFLTLPEGPVTNGPTCDEFCVKVTMAITLKGPFSCFQLFWCLCACVL